MTGNVNFMTQNVGLDLLYSIYMGKLTEKSYFCALSVIFLRLVCILKLEGLLQGYVKWKNTMTGNVNFMTQNVVPWTWYTQIYMGKLTEKSHFCALSVIFLRLVCILKLEGLLQGYVKWKNTMTGNVNFLIQNVGPWTCLSNLYVDIDRKIIFLCPLRYIFEARVHFKVGRSSSRLC